MKRVTCLAFWLFAILIMFFVSPGLTYAAPYAYITTAIDGGVWVMDLADNSKTGILTGYSPIGIAVSSTNHRAYAANFGDGSTASTVSVIDTDEKEVAGTYNVGIAPWGIAVNPAGTFVYVANSGSGNVSIIDTTSGLPATGSPVTVGSSPCGVAVAPNGAFVLVANYGGNTVSYIDASTKAVTSITVGNKPFGVAISSDGAKAYVTNEQDGTVSVIDTAGKSVVDTISMDPSILPHGIAVSPDGLHIYVANSFAHSLWTITVADHSTVTLDLGSGALPYGVDVSADGSRVYVANSGTGGLAIIDTGSNTQITGSPFTVGNSPRAFGKFILGAATPTFAITTSPGANGSISCTPNPVPQGNNSTCTITPNTGYSIATLTVDSVSQTVAGSYQFTNVTAIHTIAATFSQNTYAITTNPGAGGTISCTPNPVGYGNNSTCTITPNTGYTTTTLTVDGGSQTVAGSYQFTNVTAIHTIAATFTLNTYAITTTPGSNGTIICTPNPVGYGSNSTCAITPSTGYGVATLTVDGVSQTVATSYQFTNVTAIHTIAATFSQNTYTITTNPGTNGTISCTPNPVSYGSNSTCTIAPSANYHVATLTVDGGSQTVATSYQFTNVTAIHTIAATFAIDTFAITTSPGTGGTISCTPNPVNYGSNSTCTITPNTGYSIATLTADGVSQTVATSYQFTNVTAIHTIAATFTINTYAITTTPGSNGTISCTPNPVNYGSNSTCTITPNTGYSVATLTVDGGSQTVATSYQFTNVTAIHTIAATFSLNTYTITTSPGTGGTISCTPNPVGYGSNSTCTITPNAGYTTTTLTVDGGSQTVAGSYQFTNVTATHTIAATFTINTYAITTSPGSNGTITCTPNPVNYGSNSTCSITPSTGYSVATLTVDGGSQTVATSYQFTNVTAIHTIAATFTINTYAITTTPGTNGTISCTPNPVNYGSNSTCTITPNTGYSVATLTVDGGSQTVATSYQFTNVTAIHTIAATFTINTYAITTSPGTNGTITCTPNPVNYGSNSTCSITPSTGYSVATLTVDGVSQTVAPSYQFTNVTATHTIAATFSNTVYTITTSPGTGGTISCTPNPVSYGSNSTCTITPNTGYTTATLTVDGVAQTVATSYQFTNVTTTHTIAATFTINSYTISTSSTGNGTISCTSPVNYGGTSICTITHSTGNALETLTDNGTSVLGFVSNNTYTITNVTANHSIVGTFYAASWQSIPGTIISAPTLVYNQGANKVQMVVRGSNNTIWTASFSSSGTFNNDWLQIAGAVIAPPALAYNPVSNKVQMVVQGSGNTIWSSSFSSTGTFNNDWVQVPGTIVSPPALAWNTSSNKMEMVVRGSGDTIWASSFSSTGTFNNDWVQVTGTIISPPALVWNPTVPEAQMVVRGSGSSIWTSTFNSSGTFNNDWVNIAGGILTQPALAWNSVNNNIQMLVQGSGNTIWTATFASNGTFNNNWLQIPGSTIDTPAAVWNTAKGNLLIVVRGVGDTIWFMESTGLTP